MSEGIAGLVFACCALIAPRPSEFYPARSRGVSLALDGIAVEKSATADHDSGL